MQTSFLTSNALTPVALTLTLGAIGTIGATPALSQTIITEQAALSDTPEVQLKKGEGTNIKIPSGKKVYGGWLDNDQLAEITSDRPFERGASVVGLRGSQRGQGFLTLFVKDEAGEESLYMLRVLTGDQSSSPIIEIEGQEFEQSPEGFETQFIVDQQPPGYQQNYDLTAIRRGLNISVEDRTIPRYSANGLDGKLYASISQFLNMAEGGATVDEAMAATQMDPEALRKLATKGRLPDTQPELPTKTLLTQEEVSPESDANDQPTAEAEDSGTQIASADTGSEAEEQPEITLDNTEDNEDPVNLQPSGRDQAPPAEEGDVLTSPSDEQVLAQVEQEALPEETTDAEPPAEEQTKPAAVQQVPEATAETQNSEAPTPDPQSLETEPVEPEPTAEEKPEVLSPPPETQDTAAPEPETSQAVATASPDEPSSLDIANKLHVGLAVAKSNGDIGYQSYKWAKLNDVIRYFRSHHDMKPDLSQATIATGVPTSEIVQYLNQGGLVI